MTNIDAIVDRLLNPTLDDEITAAAEYKRSLYAVKAHREIKGRDTEDIEREIAEIDEEIKMLRNKIHTHEEDDTHVCQP